MDKNEKILIAMYAMCAMTLIIVYLIYTRPKEKFFLPQVMPDIDYE